ncbi:cation:proton antiporter domain-containing protein [Marinigracilibium pacificum]|uniref:Potassium transporter TrkA n=1 Tax=Marinigracilibium pacificum TaxID=2729599 RepID=A0A848IUT1_9BACT|nr:cation:proton antiporter [Marinigracilibium pacificum]NMM46981.1 potassium transporter TrkA [Marinigracilibium pacificum]
MFELNFWVALGGFAIVAIAAWKIAEFIQVKFGLPKITGLLISGLCAGPFIFNLIPSHSIVQLEYLFDLCLAFIAFAAGNELRIKELRSSGKAIFWQTFGQIVVAFVVSFVLIYWLVNNISMLDEVSSTIKFGISLLSATIFITRSPEAAIAVINELRAHGPLTRISMGVIVIKDVLVIMVFAVCFSIVQSMLLGQEISGWFVLLLCANLVATIVLGYVLGILIDRLLKFNFNFKVTGALILLCGFGIFRLTDFVKHVFDYFFHIEVYLEPLLICIVASFQVTNYSRQRLAFSKIIHDMGSYIYLIFFTLTGASVSVDILLKVWPVALGLFVIRILALFISSVSVGRLSKFNWRITMTSWMPYITQAGVALSLTTESFAVFGEWQQIFTTTMIALIVINQFVGPPLYKYYIQKAGEAHTKAVIKGFEGSRDVLIFGNDRQSISLTQVLKEHNWNPKIVNLENEDLDGLNEEVDQVILPEFSTLYFDALEIDKVESVVLMRGDQENLHICQLLYEVYGVERIVVKLNDRYYFKKFHELGAKIIEPGTAILSLLDHYVRSPEATSLLLGMQEHQDTIELELVSDELHGLALRDISLPSDVIVLSIKRKGHFIISHGYTRLRRGDLVTLVGNIDSLEEVSLRFEKD